MASGSMVSQKKTLSHLEEDGLSTVLSVSPGVVKF